MHRSFKLWILAGVLVGVSGFVFGGQHVLNEMQSERLTTTAKFSDFKQAGLSDWEVINKAISSLSLKDSARLIIDEDITIDRAILLPSNFTLELQADIYQADSTFDNMIRSANVVFDEDEVARVPELSISTHSYISITYPTLIDQLSNIKIIGNNHKIVASKHVPSAYHLYNGAEEPMIGDDWGSRGVTVAFTNCYDIEISDLEIRDAHCYSICFDLCQKGYIHDINIYSPVNVDAELDGVDIRTGCSNFLIENIHAETGDDAIAINSGSHPTTHYPNSKRYLYPIEGGYGLWKTLSEEDFNIKDVVARNILSKRVDIYGRGAIIYSNYGHLISDIVFENIVEPEGSMHTLDDTVILLYGGTNYVENSIYNVRLSKVMAMEAGKVVTAKCKCENICFDNLQPRMGGVEISLDYPIGFFENTNNGFYGTINSFEN